MAFTWLVAVSLTLVTADASSPWTMVFRICSGVGGDPVDTYMNNDVGQVEPLRLTDPCTEIQKSYIVNIWENKRVEQVRLSVYKDNSEKAYIVFDAKCTETTTWFDDSKIIESSYTDIRTDKELMMMYDLDRGLMFHMLHQNNSGCDDSTGWLTVINQQECDWQTTSTPAIYYSQTNQVEIFSSTDAVALADSLVVWVRFRSAPGQRADVAVDRDIVPGGWCQVEGLRTVSGFRSDAFTEDYCTAVRCTNPAWVYVDLGESMLVGAIGINPVSSGLNFTLDVVNSMLTDNDPLSYIKLSPARSVTVSELSLELSSPLETFLIRIGDNEDDSTLDLNPTCQYVVGPSTEQKVKCTEPLVGTQIYIIQYQPSIPQNLSAIISVTIYEIPDIQVHVVSTVPTDPATLTDSSLCGSYPNDLVIHTLYCQTTTQGRYAVIYTPNNTEFAFCDFQVHRAHLRWQHSVIEFCHVGIESGADLAENVTIIPSPDRPLETDGVVVGWRFRGSLVNYPTDSPMVSLQVWRYRSDLGSQTFLQLIGQVTVTVEEGENLVSMDENQWFTAEKGDFIGMTMAGPGSVVFYKNTSDIKCVYSSDQRKAQFQVGDILNFTNVWLDDWTYDVTALLEPINHDLPWTIIFPENSPNGLSRYLEFTAIEETVDEPDNGLRWKLDHDGLLINQEAFGCLDVDVYYTSYILQISDCYNVSWGVWQLNGTKICNVLLGQCLRYDESCGLNQITNCYLDVIDQATDLVLYPYFVKGIQYYGCYYSQAVSSPLKISSDDGSDPLLSCRTLCVDTLNSSLFSVMSTECVCYNRSYDDYIAIPRPYCDLPCYSEEPYDKFATCGTTITDKQEYHRSYYTPDQACVLEPGIWVPSSDSCTISGVRIGENCTISCQFGYNFSSLMNAVQTPISYDSTEAYLAGNITIMCLPGYVWTLTEEEVCEPVTCPLYNDSAVMPTSQTNNFTQTQWFDCRIGYYYVEGDHNVTCQGNGSWDGERLQCTVYKCPVISEPDGVLLVENYTNTAVIDLKPNVSGVPYNSWVRYTCRTGYRNLSDTDVYVSCQVDGRWSAPLPDCELIDCHDPPQVANAEVFVSGTYYLDNVTYHCKYGYRHTAGDLVRFCEYSGAWNATAPACTEIKCSNPPILENTTLSISDDGFLIGSVANYTCAYGYKSADPNVTVSRIQCVITQEWVNITEPISCQLIECDTPPNINFTLVNQTGSHLGDSAVYRPVLGYQISIGVIKVICSAEGIWVTPEGDRLTEETASTLATLEVITCDDPPPDVPYAIVEGTGNEYNDERQYRCNNSLPGSATSRCTLDMTWTSVDLDCEPKCSSPLSSLDLGDGVVIEDVDPDEKFSVLSTVIASCAPGYRFKSGTGMFTCTAAMEWDPGQDGPRVCEEILCQVPLPETGMQCSPESGSVNINGTLSCQCEAGIAMYESGNETRTCQLTGLWSGEKLKCKAIYCPVVSDVDKLMVSPQGNTPGKKCMFLCSDDFVLHPDDPEEMVCLSTGQWSLSPDNYPRCVDPFAPLYSENGTSNDTVDWMDIEQGDNPDIIGTNVTGVTRLPFYGGCNPPPIIPNAFGTVYNDSGVFRAVYQCMEGYNISTPETPELTCSLREWIGPVFECIPVVLCPLPDAGLYSTLRAPPTELFSVGTEITYACDDGYFAETGNELRVCKTDGTWTGTALNCFELPCPEPPVVPFASYEIDKYSKGRLCIYKCFPGYKLVSGELYKNCSSVGIWVGKNPVCEESTDPDETRLEYIEALIRLNMSETLLRLEKFGFTEADLTPTSQGIGSFEVIFLVFVAAFFIGADIPDLRREIKYRLVPNIKSCLGK